MSLIFMERDMYFSVRDGRDVVLGWLVKPSMGHSFVFSGQVENEQALGTTDLKEAIHKVTAIVVAHRLTAP